MSDITNRILSIVLMVVAYLTAYFSGAEPWVQCLAALVVYLFGTEILEMTWRVCTSKFKRWFKN